MTEFWGDIEHRLSTTDYQSFWKVTCPFRHFYSDRAFHIRPCKPCTIALWHGEGIFFLGGGNWARAEYHSKLKCLSNSKNLGRLCLAYTKLQGDFTCFNSYLLTLGTLHQQLLERIMDTCWLKVPNILGPRPTTSVSRNSHILVETCKMIWFGVHLLQTLMEPTQEASSSVNGKCTQDSCLETGQKLHFSNLPNQHGTTWAVTSTPLSSVHSAGHPGLKSGLKWHTHEGLQNRFFHVLITEWIKVP